MRHLGIQKGGADFVLGPAGDKKATRAHSKQFIASFSILAECLTWVDATWSQALCSVSEFFDVIVIKSGTLMPPKGDLLGLHRPCLEFAIAAAMFVAQLASQVCLP